jgi:hypothetical protein
VKVTSLARPRHNLEDKIKMDRKYIGRRIVNWILLIKDRGKCQTDVKTALRLQAL